MYESSLILFRYGHLVYSIMALPEIGGVTYQLNRTIDGKSLPTPLFFTYLPIEADKKFISYKLNPNYLSMDMTCLK